MEVAEIGAEAAKQQVTIEDCPDVGDTEVVATIIVASKPPAAAAPAAVEVEEEEIVERDGEITIVVEKVKIVQQENVTNAADGDVGDGAEVARTTTTTTTCTTTTEGDGGDSTTPITSTSGVNTIEPPKTNESDEQDEPTKNTNKTTKKITVTSSSTTTTATPGTPIQQEMKAVEVAKVKKQDEGGTKVEEVEEEDVEEDDEDDDEEEEEVVVEDVKDGDSGVPVTESHPAPSSNTPQQVPVAALAAPQPQQHEKQQQQEKQDTLNNTLKEIISDIDRDIEQQEDVAKLKAQQEELLKQQQLLAQQIRQQQLLAQQLAAQNKLQEQQLQQQQLKQQLQEQQLQQQPQGHVPKSTTFEESKNENGYTSKNESYEIEEKDGFRTTRQLKTTVRESHAVEGVEDEVSGSPWSAMPGVAAKKTFYDGRWNSDSCHEETSNVKKRIDLQKIFTPATDAEEILPKNRKLYASSAFYSPTLHPTVEDQVELARRISHSLSDISNQQSKGQSMYVNRKKRSVKWVHEGSGKDSASHGYEYEEESKENTEYNHDASEYNTGITTTSSSGTKTDGQMAPLAKVPLKLVMNPRGQIRDFNTEREALNTETGLMSPDKCAELVTALNTQKGKGAELFAKRRRKAEKWVVDETNAGTQSPSGLPDYHQYQPKPPTSPSILPAYSDAGKHRVQLNMHQEQLIEKYAKPGLKVVKTPWEAALETGSASAAFVEEHKLWPYSTQPTSTISPGPIPQYGYNRGASPSAGDVTDSGPSNYAPQNGQKLPQTQMQPPKQSNFNSQRDLAYKPNIPQGWKAPSVALPKDFEFHMLTKEFQKQELKFQEQQTFQGPQTFQEQETFQEQHMLQQISDAAKSCEAFTNKDEEELIRFIERSRLEPPRFHDLNSHMVRSPELSVSQISKENLLLYDNTVQEFENQLQKQLKPETHKPTPIVQDDGSKADGFHRKNGHHLIVNVGRQLQQFEEYQQLVRIQQRQEEQLVQKRVAQQRERERERELHLREKRRQDGDVFPATVTIAAKQQQSETHVQEPKRLTGSVAEDQLEYVKVAVRDLISSFEQQAQTEAEKLTKEQNTLQYWKERRQQAANKQSARKQQQKEPEQQLLNAAKQLQCQQAQEWELQKQQELQQYEQQRFQYQQQTQQQKEHDRTEQQLHHHTESGHRSSSSQYNGAADHRQAITTATPELYVPKEIPLESYAAPPVASSSLYSIPATSPISWSPAQASAFTPAHIVEGPGPKPQSYSSVVSAQVPAQSSFPLSKPLGDGGFGFCSNSHYTPPKQPHLPPNSYQTLQQGITPAPAVNFSPSPLPYDKLAKFENYSESMSPPIQSSSPHYRPLAVPGAGSKVRNLSPVPYGVRPTLAASQSLPPQPVSGYGRPGSSRPPSQQYGAPYAVGGHENSSLSPRAHVAADLSHCQNFNNAARGWGAGGNRASFGGSCRNVKPLPVTANLPYTDF